MGNAIAHLLYVIQSCTVTVLAVFTCTSQLMETSLVYIAACSQGRSARVFLGGGPLGFSFSFPFSSNMRILGTKIDQCLHVYSITSSSHSQYAVLLAQHHVEEVAVVDST